MTVVSLSLLDDRTNNFHHFVKLSLTKNPKKRPTAEKLLQVSSEMCILDKACYSLLYYYYVHVFVSLSLCPQHPFVSQPLSRTLAIELLDKSNNPDHSTFNDFDDDDPEPEVTFDLLLGPCVVGGVDSEAAVLFAASPPS